MSEVHIGDVGTIYRVVLTDEAGTVVDPSTATTVQFLFQVPGGAVITKDATVVPLGGSPPTSWELTYQIVAGDGLGSPPGEFHATAGPLKIQLHLAWADGSTFHSDIRTTDEDGRELRIYRNLE